MNPIKKKEPGAIRQLFAFVSGSSGKMRISILLAVLGEMFGIVPFLMVALLANELYRDTATIQCIFFYSGMAAICQLIKMLLTWRSSLMSHKISFTILKNIREAIADRMAKVPMGVMLETPTGVFKNLIVDNVAKLEDSMAHFMPELQYYPDFHSRLAHGACIPNHNSTGYSLFCCYDARLWPPNGKLHALCQ